MMVMAKTMMMMVMMMMMMMMMMVVVVVVVVVMVMTSKIPLPSHPSARTLPNHEGPQQRLNIAECFRWYFLGICDMVATP